jgi:hypothetical protein
MKSSQTNPRHKAHTKQCAAAEAVGHQRQLTWVMEERQVFVAYCARLAEIQDQRLKWLKDNGGSRREITTTVQAHARATQTLKKAKAAEWKARRRLWSAQNKEVGCFQPQQETTVMNHELESAGNQVAQRNAEQQAGELADTASSLINRCHQLYGRGVKIGAKTLRRVVAVADALILLRDVAQASEPRELADVARQCVFWTIRIRRGSGVDDEAAAWVQKNVGAALPKAVRDSRSPLAQLLVELVFTGVQVPAWEVETPAARLIYLNASDVRAKHPGIKPEPCLYLIPPLALPDHPNSCEPRTWNLTPAEVARVKAKVLEIFKSNAGRALLADRLQENPGYWRALKNTRTLHLGLVRRKLDGFFARLTPPRSK